MDLKLNANRFTGEKYVNIYDKYRPAPPIEIIHQTLNYLNKAKADRVVDLGCGTGISTKIWSGYATEIIGIEPSKEMTAIAMRNLNDKKNISYQIGFSNNIPLPSDSVNIITCSQSFHWMEPVSTLNEINRVLKKNGVLVIYDIIWPPSVNLEFENAYNKLFSKIGELTKGLNEVIAHRWGKKKHFNNVKKSNHFKFSKKARYHKTEILSKEQFIGIALSQGGLEALLKKGFTEKEIGITEFKNNIEKVENLPFNEITYNYQVVFGVK